MTEHGLIPELTIPLSPFISKGKKKPIVTQRIRPPDALDLHGLIKKLEPSILATIPVADHPWSVVSVYSPYSPDVHVMVMETSTDRYLPGPEWVPDDEGDVLMEVWSSVLDFIIKRKDNATIHLGYNWSPRSWGKEEEKTGFQSIPTKWHAMIWGWPELPPKDKRTPYVQWIDPSELSVPNRRLISENDYATPMGELILKKFETNFPEGSRLVELFPPWEWKIHKQGLCVSFDRSIKQIICSPNFFSQVLKPIAIVLDEFMRELTDSLTLFRCDKIDRILKKIEKKALSVDDLKKLRATPVMRSKAEIRQLFKQNVYPEDFLNAVLQPVENRCKEQGDSTNWWRKGFGYSLVLSSSAKESSSTLRIMPGVYTGSGGVVEAQGVVLRRPEDKKIPVNDIRRKSRVLWELVDVLKNQYAIES